MKVSVTSPASTTLMLSNWSYLKYTSAVYEIVPTTDGRFCANIHLFLNEPMKGEDARKNSVVIVPLNIAQDSPQKVIIYLYLLGPIFNHTSNKALEIDESGKVVKVWSIEPPNHTPALDFKAKDGVVIKPTHSGSDSIN